MSCLNLFCLLKYDKIMWLKYVVKEFHKEVGEQSITFGVLYNSMSLKKESKRKIVNLVWIPRSLFFFRISIQPLESRHWQAPHIHVLFLSFCIIRAWDVALQLNFAFCDTCPLGTPAHTSGYRPRPDLLILTKPPRTSGQHLHLNTSPIVICSKPLLSQTIRKGGGGQ